MTSSEFGFLLLGLTLGIAGASLGILALRRRPAAPREVRLTVTKDSVPRRSSTLSSPTLVTQMAPATGGPADPAGLLVTASTGTPVPFGARLSAPQPAAATLGPALSPAAARAVSTAPFRLDQISVAGRGRIAVPVRPEGDMDLSSLVAARPRVPGQVAPVPAGIGPSGSAGVERSVGTAVAAPPTAARASASPASDVPSAGSGAGVAVASAAPADAAGSNGQLAAAPDDACTDARAAATERCGMADRLQVVASTATDRLREHQRAYDGHIRNVETAESTLDPRALRDRKEAAQRAFRQATPTHAPVEATERAAREWLAEINRINLSAREATIRLKRERDAANQVAPLLERLSIEADAARITAEAAAEDCRAAREALAACEEAHRRPVPAAAASPTPTQPVRAPAPETAIDEGQVPDEDARLAAAVPSEEALILRLLRGDGLAMEAIVTELAGPDEAERRRWRVQLGDLVEAIVARAIEASAFEFPQEHPFWGLFTRAQDVEVTRALASLGYRFDGFGAFADGRSPSQRDLSLAIGYAGLDPGRVRRWPSEADMPKLFDQVTVAADEYLAEEAGGLTLGEMVTLLGRRADSLTDLWNAWGRVRPLLLATQ